MRKLLLIDDDRTLAMLLKSVLSEHGFELDWADRPSAGLPKLADRPELLLLDVMMPEQDGFEVCRQLRERGEETPIIMLTGRGDDMDRIKGLNLGADDYLPKPFNPRELVARIHAVLRRRAAPPPAGAPATAQEVVRFGPVEVNLATRELVREGTTTMLTTGEFGLLQVLLRHPRQPLSRDKLMELARGREHGVFDRAIDVQISRLRKLVEPDPAKPRHIQTVWGFGYVFVPDEQKAAGAAGDNADAPDADQD